MEKYAISIAYANSAMPRAGNIQSSQGLTRQIFPAWAASESFR
jgi:hypothetical protein